MAKNRIRRPARRWLRGAGVRLADWARHSAAGLAVIGGLAFAGAAGWTLVQRSSYFTIRTVEANETPHLDRAAIVSTAGLDGPVNLFRFDAVAAEEALTAHPWVATAQVLKRLPDRVDIHISERVPAAIVSMGGLYVVDADGQPFVRVGPALARAAGQGESKPLPLVTGLVREGYEKDPAAAWAQVRDALALGRLYARSPLAAAHPLSNVHIGEGGALELMLGRTRVVMGHGDHKAKLERLARIYETLGQRGMDAAYVLMDEAGRRSVVKEVPLARPVVGAL